MIQNNPSVLKVGQFNSSLSYKNTNVTPPRCVSLYEIEYALEDGGISIIDGKDYPIYAHRVIIAKPGQTRSTKLPYKCIFFKLKITDPTLSELLSALSDSFVPVNTQIVEHAIHSLVKVYAKGDSNGGLNILAQLYFLLSLLIQEEKHTSSRKGNSEADIRVVEEALTFMNRRYCEKITLSDIAAHVHLSRIYFHKLFCNIKGITPYRYLLSKRITYAKHLMLTTTKQLNEIADACGFSSQSYFHQVFKREEGISPMQYKKNMSLIY